MVKFSPDVDLDASFIETAKSVTQTVCSAQPANFAGIAAVALASATITAGLGNGDWTAADGDVSGRKVTVTEQTGITVDTSGTATHVVYDDGTLLHRGTTVTSQSLTAGNTLTVAAHKFEIEDPT